MKSGNIHHRRLDALVKLLAELAELHGQMLDGLESKIEAMRVADTHRIEEAVRAELQLIERIHERERLRRQLTENIARGYGISPAIARQMSAAQLAVRVGGPFAGKINAEARRLKEMTERISRRNSVASTVSQNVLRHLKKVFAAMTASESGKWMYSPAGDLNVDGGQRIFDAVG